MLENAEYDHFLLDVIPDLLSLIARHGGHAVADLGHTQRDLREPLNKSEILKRSNLIKSVTHDSCVFGLSSAWFHTTGEKITRLIR